MSEGQNSKQSRIVIFIDDRTYSIITSGQQHHLLYNQCLVMHFSTKVVLIWLFRCLCHWSFDSVLMPRARANLSGSWLNGSLNVGLLLPFWLLHPLVHSFDLSMSWYPYQCGLELWALGAAGSRMPCFITLTRWSASSASIQSVSVALISWIILSGVRSPNGRKILRANDYCQF